MKRETIELFSRIYTRMMERTSDALLEKDSISVHDYCKAMVAAQEHIYLFMEDMLIDDVVYVDMNFNVMDMELDFNIDYCTQAIEDKEVTQDDLTKLVAHSSDWVAADDFLCEMLGTDAYVDIIEQANILVIEGLVVNEDLDKGLAMVPVMTAFKAAGFEI